MASKHPNVETAVSLRGESIPATLTYRKCRSISFRKGEGRSLKVSAPYRTSLAAIQKAAEELAPRLLRLLEAPSSLPAGGNGHYFLGKFYPDPLTPALEKEERKAFYAYVLASTRKYEAILDIYEPYRVSFRKMSTRLGSNSRKTHKITYSLSLMAYDPHIVDSVVVHELAHHFFFDHQKGFHLLLRSAFPDYEKCRKKLLRRDYRWEGEKKE